MRKINIGNLPPKKELPVNIGGLEVENSSFPETALQLAGFDKTGNLGTEAEPTLPDHYTRKGYVDTTIQTLIDTIVGGD